MAFLAALNITEMWRGRAESSSAIWLHNLAWRSEFFCCSGLLNPYDWFLPPTKLVRLSHTTSSGKPRRDAIRKNAFRNESVSRLNATSRCTALVAKHVNRQRYLFWWVWPLPCLVIKGPPKSTDVWLKACKDLRLHNSGKGAIVCLAGEAFLLQRCSALFLPFFNCLSCWNYPILNWQLSQHLVGSRMLSLLMSLPDYESCDPMTVR